MKNHPASPLCPARTALALCIVHFALCIVAQAATTLPAGYTRLAYIESTGTQYIDTGLTPTKNFRILVDMAWTSPKNTGGFGYASATASKEQSFRLYSRVVVPARGTTEFRVNVNDHYGRFNTYAIPTTNDTARHVIDLSNTRKSIDGVLFGDTSGLTKTLQSTFYLFAIRYSWSPYIGQYGYHRLYSCRLYEGATLKRDFVPCTNGNGDAGLYDLVTATMYLNNGTGTFVCGPIASETLDVAPLPFAIDGASPAQGLTDGLAAGDSFVCSVPAACTNAAGDTAATCTGYIVYTNGVVYTQGATSSFTYTHPAHEAGARLEWQWDVQYRVDAETSGGSVSPATQWVAAGSSATVEVTPDAGCTFTRWTSSSRGATLADATANPATFTVNGPAKLSASCVTPAGPLQAELSTTGYQGLGSLTKFPVLARISPARIPGFSYADCAPDGSDIAFSLADGTFLPFEIDTWNPAGESLVWVRLPEMIPYPATSFLFQWRGARTTPNDPTAVWADDYVAVWHMNEIDANGNIPDATGHGFNAHTTSVAQVTSASGSCIVGPAVQLKSGYLKVPDYEAAFPDAGGVFTVSGWFKHPGGTAGWNKIWNKKTTANGDTAKSVTGWMFEMKNNTTQIAFIRKSGASTALTLLDITKNWNYLAVSSAGTKVRSYVNGVNISSGNVDAEFVPSSKPLGLLYGVVNAIADEFRIRRGPPPSSDYWFQAEYCTAKESNFVTCGAVRPAGPAFTCEAVDSGETSLSAGWRVPYGSADIYAAWGASPGTLNHTNLLVAAAAGAGTNSVTDLPAASALYVSFFAEANGLRSASTKPYLFATRDAVSASATGPAIIITGTNRVDGAITSLHAVFGPATTNYSVLVASGTSDGHGDLAAWDRFRSVAQISADVRECDIAMPATWGDTEFYLRLFLAEGLVQPYDYRVEYVLTTQAQHFVTPFIPTPRTCVSADLAFTEVSTLQQRVFSAESSSIIAPQFEAYVNNDAKISFAMYQTQFKGRATSTAGTARRLYEIDAYNRACRIANSSVVDLSGDTLTMNAATNFTLLARYPSGTYRGGGKLYGAQIKEAGVPVANYVPCVADGEAVLCETLTGTILKPRGSGVTAGPVVQGSAPSASAVSSSATVTDLSDEPIVLFLEATPKAEGPVTLGWDLAYPGIAGDTAAIYVAWGYEPDALRWTNLVYAAAPAGVFSNDLSCFPSNRICHARLFAVNGGTSEPTDLLSFTTSTNAPGVAPRAPYIAAGWTLTGKEEGDTIHIAGELASMGEAASVAVIAEISRAGDFSDAVVWPVATLSQPGAFTATFHTNDTASAAYIAPGSTVSVRLRAVAEGVPDDLTTPSQYTMRSKSTFGTISNTTASNLTLTFKGKLSALGMNTTTVWLFWSSTDGSSGSKLVTSFGPFDSVANEFSTTVAFSTGSYGETITSYFVASNSCSTAATSVKSASKTYYFDESATYTWKADSLGNWNGSWADSAHWSSSLASSKCRGWPKAKSSTAVFPASCTAEVTMASSSLTIKTLDLSAKKLNLTFLGTGKTLTLSTSFPAGALNTNRYDSVLVFDHVGLNVTAGKYYLPVGGGSVFELRNGSTLTCPYLSMYSGTAPYHEAHFIIRQGCSANFTTSLLLGGGGVVDVFGSLSVTYNIWMGVNIGGGKLFVHETAESVNVPENFQFSGSTADSDIEVALPAGGASAIPIQGGTSTKSTYLAVGTLTSATRPAFRFHVSGPVRHETEEVSYPILYWAAGINTNRVDLSSPGSPRGELYYTWRNSPTATTGTGLPTYIWYRQKRVGGTVLFVQ